MTLYFCTLDIAFSCLLLYLGGIIRHFGCRLCLQSQMRLVRCVLSALTTLACLICTLLVTSSLAKYFYSDLPFLIYLTVVLAAELGWWAPTVRKQCSLSWQNQMFLSCRHWVWETALPAWFGFLLLLWNKGHLGVRCIWLHSLGILLTRSILSGWVGNQICGSDEHHFCNHWLSGPYNTEQNKRSKHCPVCPGKLMDCSVLPLVPFSDFCCPWYRQHQQNLDPSASSHACKWRKLHLFGCLTLCCSHTWAAWGLLTCLLFITWLLCSAFQGDTSVVPRWLWST